MISCPLSPRSGFYIIRAFCFIPPNLLRRCVSTAMTSFHLFYFCISQLAKQTDFLDYLCPRPLSRQSPRGARSWSRSPGAAAAAPSECAVGIVQMRFICSSL